MCFVHRKALLQRRTALRTWLRLSARKIESLLAESENPPSCTEVQVATDDYVKYSEELEMCQGKIADTTAEGAEFPEKYKPVYVQALQFLEAQSTSLPPTAGLPRQGDLLLKSTVSEVSSARLPKLELPKFTT